MSTFDVAVVGARCGGASTAMLLARKGYKVLLTDKVTFPKEIPHGHFIHRHGPARLHRWGLLDRIKATACPAVTSMVSDLGDFPLVGNDLSRDGIALGYAPRRAVLDHLLVEAAVQAGAELWEGFKVDSYLTEGDKITGIKGQNMQGGSILTEKARVTVGADGRNSLLARFVKASAYEETSPVTFWYFSYWSGIPTTALEIYIRANKVIFVFPTNDQRLGIFIGWAKTENLTRIRSNIEKSFHQAIEEIPDLAEKVAQGTREEPFYGATDLPNFFRKPAGPGWALVGDAGCHKDPYLALGICDALRDAELLSDALDEGLSGRNTMERAMEDYELKRNQATMADFQLNLHLAQFKPFPAEMMQLRQALRHNQTDTNQYFMANEGMIDRSTFFNPVNINRILAPA